MSHEYKGSEIALKMLSAEQSKSPPVASTWYDFDNQEERVVSKYEEATIIVKVKSAAADTITVELEVFNPVINGWAKAPSTYSVTCDGSTPEHVWVGNLNLAGITRVRASRYQSDGTGNITEMNVYLVMKV